MDDKNLDQLLEALKAEIELNKSLKNLVKKDIETLTEIHKRIEKLMGLSDSKLKNIHIDDAEAATFQAIKSLERFLNEHDE